MANIITIGREFGSGGREIGKRLADELGYAYFDKEIISAMAKEKGFDEEYIKNVLVSSYMPVHLSFSNSFAVYAGIHQYQTSVLVAQRKSILSVSLKITKTAR